MHCGIALVDGRCPACSADLEARVVRREFFVLLVLSAVVVAGFFATRAAAEANERLRLKDASVWFALGDRDLAEGRTDSAIRALRRAVALDRNTRTYRLALASALAAGGQDDLARQVLLASRALTPEDPDINLELARLEARHGERPDAVRYYQSAMYGSWRADQQTLRRQVRVELIRYLLEHGDAATALSELLVLSGNLPADVPAHVEAAQLFLEAGDPRRALEHFQRALQVDAQEPAALAGAGESAFRLGDYTAAQRYLRAAARRDPQPPQVAELTELTTLILTRDPLAPRLSLRERADRLALARARARDRVGECLADGAAISETTRDTLEALRTELQAWETAARQPGRGRSLESIEDGMTLVYRIEQQTADICGAGQPVDRALLLVGERHDLGRR